MRGEAASPARREVQGGGGPGPLKLGGDPCYTSGRSDLTGCTWEIRNVGRHDIHLLLSLPGTACTESGCCHAMPPMDLSASCGTCIGVIL